MNDGRHDAAGEAAVVAEVFETMPVALVGLSGPEHRYLAANAAYRTLIGRADVVDRPIREVLPEIAGQQLFEWLDRVLVTGEPAAAQEWRVQLAPDGESRDRFISFSEPFPTWFSWRG